MAGVIDSEDVSRFKRIVFRSTKGKSFVHTEQVSDEDKKSVYIVTFQDGGFLRDKIQKICDSFSGQRYDLPEVTELAPQIMKMKSNIETQIKVVDHTKHQLRQQLIEFDRI